MVLFAKSCHLLTIVFLWIWSPILAEPKEAAIVISVVKVRKYGVEIDWHLKNIEHSASWGNKLSNCELVYGPVNNPQQVQVLPYNPSTAKNRNHVGGHILELYRLQPKVTYHFHMICYNSHGKKYFSNSLNFTTGVKKISRNKGISKKDDFRRRRRPSFRYNEPNEMITEEEDSSSTSSPSSNVILGSVCGIVGFLIINITVVMGVRKYSQRQMRRRHMLGLEEQDYDGFQYLQDIE